MTIKFDPGTAAFLTALASFSAGYWLLLQKLAHRTIAGVSRSWAISLILQGLGWTLIGMRLVLPPEISAIPGTLFVLLAAVLQLKAFTTLRRHSLEMGSTYALYAVTAGVHLFYGYAIQNGPARVLATSVFAAIVGVQTIWVLGTGKERAARGLIKSLIGLYAIIFLVLIARGVYFASRLSEPGMDVYSAVPGNQIGYAAFFLTSFLPSWGFFSLCNDLYDQRQQSYAGELSKISGELHEQHRIEEQLLIGLAGFVYRCRNDAEWTITYISRGAREITGYPGSDFIESKARSFGSIMWPGDVDRVWSACQASIAARKNCSNEYRIITASGETRWVWDQAHGVYGEDGSLRHIEGLITDITARKAQDTRLENLNFLYRLIGDCNRAIARSFTRQSLFENIVQVCTVNAGLKLAWFSEQKPDESHVSLLAAAGDAVGYLDTAYSTGRHPENADAAAMLRYGICSNKTIRILRDADVEIQLHLYAATPDFFTEERGDLFSQITSDILQALDRIDAEEWRHIAETRLRENTTLLDFALESTVDAVWDFDPIQNQVTFSRNWESMLGFETGELRNDLASWEARIHPEDLLHVNARLRAYIAGDLPFYESVQRVLAKSGQYVWIKDRGIIVARDDNGNALRLVGTMKNIHAETVSQVEAAKNAAVLEALVENAPVGISIIDNNHVVIRSNPRVAEFYGIQNGVDTSQVFSDAKFFYEDGEPYPHGRWPDVFTLPDFRKSQTQVFGYQHEGAGEKRWFSVSSTYVPNFDLAIRISTEITAQKSAEIARRESSALLEAIFNNAPVGFSVSTEGQKILRMNPKLIEILGAPEKMDFAQWRLAVQYFREDGEPYPMGTVPPILSVHGPQVPEHAVFGRQIPGETSIRWVSISATYLEKQDVVVRITSDITEQRRQAEKLRQSEAKFRGVFELIPVGLALINQDRTLVQYNSRLREISGMDDGELKEVRNHMRTYWRPGGFPIPEQDLPIARAIKDGKPIYDEVFGIKAGDRMRWVSASVAPIAELGLFVGILTDISEIVAARHELEMANQDLEARVAERTRELMEVNAELESFSYSLSHDMKAPLTRMESWINVLQEEYRAVLGENGTKALLFLRQELANMQSMIRSMLALAKASTADIAPSPVDLSALAELEIALLRDTYPELKIEFTVEPGLQTTADATLVTVLLRNLLQNAVKFSSKRDVAKVQVGQSESQGQEDAFFVRDNGDGFEMRYADKLFAPFQRMHTQKEFPGTGIGLATAQRIVHRHGGKIWAESVKGEGSTFFFVIPRVARAGG